MEHETKLRLARAFARATEGFWLLLFGAVVVASTILLGVEAYSFLSGLSQETLLYCLGPVITLVWAWAYHLVKKSLGENY